jgi:Ran GTPase-activating protein (RanGAP) involved in mRNA processing and transport
MVRTLRDFMLDCERLKCKDATGVNEINDSFFSLPEEDREGAVLGLFAEALAVNPSLFSLSLSNFGGFPTNELSPELWHALAGFVKRCPTLQKLKLDDVACYSEQLVRSIAQAPYLSDLTLSRMIVGREEALNLQHVLSKCTRLKVFRLQQIDMKCEEAPALIAQGLEENASIQICSMFQVYDCERILEGLVNHSTLTNLMVENCVKSGNAIRRVLTSPKTLLERLTFTAIEIPHALHASLPNDALMTGEEVQRQDPWLNILKGLEENKTVKDFRVVSETFTTDRAGGYLTMLMRNTKLRMVVFSKCACQGEVASLVLEGLAADTTLVNVQFSECSLKANPLDRLNATVTPGVLVSRLLKSVHTLTHLGLIACYLNDSDACALASSLRENSSLQKLDIQRNSFSSDALESLVAALQVNKYIRLVDIRGNKDMWKSTEVTNRFIRALPRMQGLKVLRMDAQVLTELQTGMVVDAVAEQARLEYIDLAPTGKDKQRLALYFEAHKFGRGLVLSETPYALWPYILARVALRSRPSVLFYMMRQKVELVKVEAGRYTHT